MPSAVLRPAFEKVRSAVRASSSAALEPENEGQTYVRNFRPRERLLLLAAAR